jgi:cAMP-dependent protein kinase regulator
MSGYNEEELNTYLAEVGMKDVVKEMTTSVLTAKPEEPIGHLIKYLYETYPDKAKEAKTGASGGGAGGGSTLAALMNTDVGAEDSDDEDDYIDENAPEYVPPKNMSKKGRKTGVSAESMDPAKMKEKMKNLTVIEKTPEVRDNLLAIIAKSAMLKMLDEEQKDAIVKAFAGPLTKAAGEDIITKGDIGETFFLLEEGAVDVYINKPGEDDIKVHTYSPGDGFGELALMYNAPRAATCRAQNECKVWSLDRESFKVIVVAAAMLKREMYQGFLEKVPILKSCNPGEIQTLADSLAEETYEDGAEICTQGTEGHFFYIIKEGEAKCFVDGNEVASLGAEKYFGEIALLTAKPRQATVKASGKLKVLAIDRATFTRVLGPLDDILKRNMEDYNAKIGAEV